MCAPDQLWITQEEEEEEEDGCGAPASLSTCTKPCYEMPELLLAWPFPAPSTLAAPSLLWVVPRCFQPLWPCPGGWQVPVSWGDAVPWIPAELGCQSCAYLSKVFAVPCC